MNYVVDINRPKDTYVIGRNGTWKAQGIEVLHSQQDTVLLTPIGKRGVLNAGFAIPIETMDELCDKWLKNRDPQALRKMRKTKG